MTPRLKATANTTTTTPATMAMTPALNLASRIAVPTQWQTQKLRADINGS